jgi:hypothetical protein
MISNLCFGALESKISSHFSLSRHCTKSLKSTTATVVDVEQSFSFGREYVSLRRHQPSPSSVTYKGMAVACCSKNGKIKPGVLDKWKLNKANEAKLKIDQREDEVQ